MAVCGGSSCDDDTAKAAYDVGAGLARAGAVVLTGGRGGVMEAASRGAASEGGIVVGILPGLDRDGANDHLGVSIPTGMGEMRNMVLVNAADAVIALPGEYGTLSEIAYALRVGKPVIGLGTWEFRRAGEWDEGIRRAASPEEAVALALSGEDA